MNKQLQEQIRCRLYLNSVLGALPKLLRLSSEAVDLLGDNHFSIKFSTMSGLHATVVFRDGGAAFHDGNDVPADINLFFVSDTQVNNLFSQEGISVPLPVKGIFQMKKIKVFKNLADLLQRYLKPTPEDLEDNEFKNCHVQILLGLAVRSLCQLGTYDPDAKQHLGSMSGMAEFIIGDDFEPAWIMNTEGKFECGFGKSPSKPDVIINFENTQVALDALNDTIDVNAEVGLGKIKVSGLVPLADKLGLLMQRIPLYIQ